MPTISSPLVELLTTGEAARHIGKITPAGVVAAAKRGQIAVAARTERGVRLFTLESVESFRARREKRALKEPELA